MQPEVSQATFPAGLRQSGEGVMVGEEAHRPPESCCCCWRGLRRCLWTRCTCSGPSSWSPCSASSWRCAWTWWLCWVQPGSPPSISPCLSGSPAPSPRLGKPRRRLRGAASPPSHLVGGGGGRGFYCLCVILRRLLSLIFWYGLELLVLNTPNINQNVGARSL